MFYWCTDFEKVFSLIYQVAKLIEYIFYIVYVYLVIVVRNMLALHHIVVNGHCVGIPVICEHAIAYFAKIRISHILPHIMAFSKLQIFIYA